MISIPHSLYTAAQTRELDSIAIKDFGIPGAVLMGNAGSAAFSLLRDSWPQARRVAVVCGVGNNAGDGFVVARLAHEAGLDVVVFQVGEDSRLGGDARDAAVAMSHSGLKAGPFSTENIHGVDVIVDALLGTGLDRDVTDDWRDAINSINAAHCPVFSLDIPSGLHADTGAVLGTAVRADITITFIGLKQGMFTAFGPDHCGKTVFDDLGVPADVYERITPAATRIQYDVLKELLLPRVWSAHKGHFGHVLVMGGDYGMSGAARMAGEAAARMGAGRVSIATREEHASMLTVARPELMSHGIETAQACRELVDKASVIAIGPGLGQTAWAEMMLGVALGSTKPLVVDADALNLLAVEPMQRSNWVLTPHPAEAARLLGLTTSDIQSDRFVAIQQLQQRYGGVCVLKGTGTLIFDHDSSISLCNEGNPGMASGGMGDVLTGVIAGLITQGLGLSDAARLGVCIHARAGDRAAISGERGLLATDLIAQLRHLANPF